MEFSINKEYAEKYNKWREKEEYQKLKDRYGDVSGEDSTSSSSSEDEDAEGLTPQLEKDWLTTLAAIKSKNPKIYDKDVQFYQAKSDSSSSDDQPRKKLDKPMFLKDYERKVILEKGGKLSDEEESSSGSESKDTDKPGYYEIQEEIRKSIVGADVSSDSDEDFLTKRNKTKQQLEKEECDYIDWLKGQKEELSDEDTQAGVALDPLKNYWNDPELPEGEKFLRDYILNKRFLEEDEEVPTYDDIVNFSEEEEQLEREETFEHKYNFRFEDPDPEFIKTHPRTISDTVRRKDTKRAEKRQEIKERKQKEKDKQKEEIKQLKNLKKREIESRITQLREVTGENLDIAVTDLDGDFDPEAHDRLMKKVFSTEYYDQDCDDEKPTWSDDDELDLKVPEYDKWTGSGNDVSKHGADDNSSHDDSESNDSDSSSDTEQRVKSPKAGPSQPHSDSEDATNRKKQKKTQFQKVVDAKKPLFDPGQKSFSEYLEEYYKLDYEDFVAGQPCRFRYRNVVANDFGLSTDEVLSAKETELNRWVSLKRMSQYRTEEEEKIDVRIFDKKGQNAKKKLNVLPSLQESEEVPEQSQGATKKRKRKRKKKKSAEQTNAEQKNPEDTNTKDTAKKQKLNDSIHEGAKSEHKDSEKSINVASSNSEKQNSEKNSSKKKKKKDKSKNREKSAGNNIENRGFKSTIEKVKVGGDEMKPNKDKMKLNNKDKLNKKKAKRLKVKLNKKKAAKLKDKKKKKKGKKPGVLSEERLKAYGIDPKKFKYTHSKTDNKKS